MDADDRGSLGRDPGANALPAACAMAQFRACQWESVRTRTAQKRRLADPGGVHFYRNRVSNAFRKKPLFHRLEHFYCNPR